jgi:hypothetical protein
MSVEGAYQRAMDTVHQWVQKEVDASKTLAIFRTYSPAHTRHAYIHDLHELLIFLRD